MARRVLVVEDDDDLRNLTAATLRGAGFSPISAISAEDGLALLETGRCDLAFLDVKLPGMNGLDALGAITARWPGFPVIVTTASERVGEAEVMARGARGFLRKPFSADRLLMVIAEALPMEAAPASAAPGTVECDHLNYGVSRPLKPALGPVQLSERGVTFVAFDFLGEGMELALEIGLPGRKESMRAGARVMGLSPAGKGDRWEVNCQFLDVQEAAVQQLARYFNARRTMRPQA